MGDVQGSSALGVNYPRKKLSRCNNLRAISLVGTVHVQLSGGAIVLGGNCLGGIVLGGTCLGGIVLGENCSGGNCLGGICPGEIVLFPS